MVAQHSRRWGKLLLGLILLLIMSLPLITSAEGNSGAKIDPGVQDDLAATGEATFWAVLVEQADLSAAYNIADRTERGAYVVDKLQAVAAASQAGLLAELARSGAPHQSFWVLNSIKITGNAALVNQLAARGEVARIMADRPVPLPEPMPAKEEALINAVEWGIARINADDVWSSFGVRGEGIVVANIDTGVDYDHPAVVSQYRGNLGGGAFDHNYNWHDPSNVCGTPSLVPCDNNDHGTHTMGTMVGDDGGANQIGVAPAARWIAAKGCESGSCSNSALLSSAQWILAPTDLNGNNPMPSLRPHVVNNSWGGGGGDPWYQASVDAWVASGIFPAFSNGNSGPSCGSSGSPGDYVASYAAGAFDINDNIASFSSRGPSAFGGEIKPNIAAPGVSVRSAINGGGYASFNGTSMASPHVAGVVALMWSAAPSLERDIAGTMALLDNSAVDTNNVTCGGTAADNNVWGEGKLDAFAAVDQSPRGPTGNLAGNVSSAVVVDAGGSPIAGATVRAVGPSDRTATTDGSGNYDMRLPVGSYDVTASAFGYSSQTVNGVAVAENATTTQNFVLAPAPSYPVLGIVRRSTGGRISGASVTIEGAPIAPTTTNSNGVFYFPSVPGGTYDITAMSGRCTSSQTLNRNVNAPTFLIFTLTQRSDGFGYTCSTRTVNWIAASVPLALSGDDVTVSQALPFSFPFYGSSYNTVHMSSNGHLNFLGPNTAYSNSPIPSAGTPNGAVYAYWDDLVLDGSSSAWYQSLSIPGNNAALFEWRNVRFYADTTRRVDVQVILFQSGHILVQYRNIDADGREQGSSATLGIENSSGTVALQYSYNEAVLTAPEFAILYRHP